MSETQSSIDVDINVDKIFAIDIIGGLINPSVTALLLIEYQNDFVHEDGALYKCVESELKRHHMLSNSKKLLGYARQQGVHIIHAPITYCADYEENAHRYGVLYNVATNSAFEDEKWGAQFHSCMEPKESEHIVKGKHGLDTFAGTDLDDILQKLRIVNIVIAGCLTNCCVESTMRTAYEFGYNVITIHDCCVATSQKEHDNSVNHTFKMFSIPITCSEFMNCCLVANDVIDELMCNKFKELPPSSVMHSRQKVEYLKMKSSVLESMIARLVNLVVLVQLLVTSMDLAELSTFDEGDNNPINEYGNSMIDMVLLYVISGLDFILTLLLFGIWCYCNDRSKYENNDSCFATKWRTYRVTSIKFIFRTFQKCISVVAICKLMVCVSFAIKEVAKNTKETSTIIAVVFTVVSGVLELVYVIYEIVKT